MAGRILKQVFYIGLVLLIIGAIFLAIYWRRIFPAFTPTCYDGIQNQNEEGIDCGAVCGISCEEKYLKELSYSTPQIFRLGDLVSLYFDLVNSNSNFGLKNFKYRIDFYGFADKLLESVSGESFIYPGETKKIVEAGQKVLGEIKRTEIFFSDVNWRPASDFRSIRLENKGLKISKKEDFFVVSGKIKNLNSFTVSQVIINGFLTDKSGNVLGVSKNMIDKLDPFSEQSYAVTIQISSGQEANIDFSGSQIYIYPI